MGAEIKSCIQILERNRTLIQWKGKKKKKQKRKKEGRLRLWLLVSHRPTNIGIKRN